MPSLRSRHALSALILAFAASAVSLLRLGRSLSLPGPPNATHASQRAHVSTSRRYEFNDKLVTPYPPERIPADCFGGVDVVQRWHEGRRENVAQSVVRHHSAYILVYDRKCDDGLSARPCSMRRARRDARTPSLCSLCLGPLARLLSRCRAVSSNGDVARCRYDASRVASALPSTSRVLFCVCA